jgi:hypothetical protein
MANNSAYINKTSYHFSFQIKTTTYDVGNPVPGLGQAIQIATFVPFPLNEATTFCFYNIANKYLFSLKRKK